jgi:putative effector of murein hydrolase
LTIGILTQPVWLAILFIWCFAVLAAAQLTIRLIMAFSIRQTVLGAIALTVLAYPVAALYDVVLGPAPSLGTRLNTAPVAMLLMGLAGFVVARWVLRIRRVRGQVAAALMIGVLDPHLFALLSS